MNALKSMADLEEEHQYLRAKLTALQPKKQTILEAESQIHMEILRVENQMFRLKNLQQTPQ